jgi:hypothetical protein
VGVVARGAGSFDFDLAFANRVFVASAGAGFAAQRAEIGRGLFSDSTGDKGDE